jgi:hypothetical protein
VRRHDAGIEECDSHAAAVDRARRAEAAHAVGSGDHLQHAAGAQDRAIGRHAPDVGALRDLPHAARRQERRDAGDGDELAVDGSTGRDDRAPQLLEVRIVAGTGEDDHAHLRAARGLPDPLLAARALAIQRPL